MNKATNNRTAAGFGWGAIIGSLGGLIGLVVILLVSTVKVLQHTQEPKQS